ncbi:MAG: HIT domain-containing protein [Candidatus Binatia bacterium]|nr:HIT domain-containing protein [Candidatus Binatia bacterium]
MSYVVGEKPAPDACFFCDLPGAGDDRENLILATDDRCVVMMNRYPYNNGHLMVAPREHTAELGVLDPETYAHVMEMLRRTAGIVRTALACDGMNIGLNLGKVAGAGVDSHLHWHIVPRWNGDTNFMPVVAETKVMPQHLLACYDQLAPHFA